MTQKTGEMRLIAEEKKLGTHNQRFGSGSKLDPDSIRVSGSVPESGIRIQEGKNDPTKKEKNLFEVLDVLF
jgi:hypothetical protein